MNVGQEGIRQIFHLLCSSSKTVTEQAQTHLQPRELEVSVDVGAVGVAVAQVPVVVVAVVGHGHATVGADADCKRERQNGTVSDVIALDSIAREIQSVSRPMELNWAYYSMW